jgi:acetyl esterase/lipase
MEILKKSALIFLLIFFIFSCKKKDNGLPNDDSGNSTLKESTLVNISYGNHERQKYDIHLPAGRDSNTPVILMIHGGAWKAGQKEDLNNYVNIIKNKWSKVAIVNMNYRLASNQENIHHGQIMADIKSVIEKVINNQNEYHISTNMGIVGASAGGQLAMIYAYKYNDYSNIKCTANIFGPSIINDWSWYDSNNIWLGGYVGDILTEYVGEPWGTTAYKNVSPYWNITSNSQPMIMFHGSLDPIVPVYQSQWMHGKLNNLNVTNEYHEYVAFHGFDNTQNQDVVSKMVTFFKTHID